MLPRIKGQGMLQPVKLLCLVLCVVPLALKQRFSKYLTLWGGVSGNGNLGPIHVKPAYIGYLVFLLLFLAGSGIARASSETPVSVKTADAGALLNFYKTVVSSTDGERCGMFPCCSSYAAGAFKKHGFFLGWIMSCDRLIRCGRDETHLSPHIRSGNRILTVDTLEDNDFWWYPGN